MESYVLPKNLRINREDVNFVSSGMEVIKVSKVGPVMLGKIFLLTRLLFLLFASSGCSAKFSVYNKVYCLLTYLY